MKLYRLVGDDEPVVLDQLPIPLTDSHRAALEQLECGAVIELLNTDGVYGEIVRCCGTRRQWAAVEVLEGYLGEDAFAAATQVLNAVDKIEAT